MICPKCGQEYTGDSCPRCEGPKIIVNNQEYLQRKMEYEKKQAEVKSASSSDADKNVNTEEKKKTSGEEVKPDEVFKKIVDRAKQEGGNAGKAISRSASKHKNLSMKMAKRILVALVAVTAVILCAGVVIKVVRRNNQTLYTRYNGKIYNVSGIDSKYVCDYDKAYFKIDGKDFYVPDEPEDVAGKTVLTRVASDNGKYYLSEVYDESSNRYTLYLWNNDVNYKLSENSNKKSIMYLSDDGNVVYKENEMINDVGGMGKTSLYVSQLTKTDSGFIPTTTQLSEQVRQSCVYSDRQLVIYNTEDDVLYSFYYGKNKKESVIDTDVTAIYPMTVSKKGYYSYRAPQLNTDKDVSSLVYVSGNKAKLYDCLDKNAVSSTIDDTTSVTGEYIVTDSGVYSINSSNIKYASYKNKQLGKYSEAVSLGNTANILYFADKETIIAVAADGNLQSVNKGTAKNITDGVLEGSLSAVNNTDTGITYIRNNVQYYYNISSSKEMVMTEAAGNTSTSDTLMYRNRLYYYNSDGKMCSCTVRGRDDKLIGDVEKFWLGK